jgi:hypothetical protein
MDMDGTPARTSLAPAERAGIGTGLAGGGHAH